MSDSLWPHGLQHTRLPCPSSTPGAYLNSCPPSRWGHPTISSFICPLLLLPSIFPASGFFPMSQFFVSGGQSTEAPASASVLPVKILVWFPVGLTSLIFFLSEWLARVFSRTTIQKHQFFGTQPSLWCNVHIHIWLLEKPCLWLYRLLLAKWYLWFLIHCLVLS